MYGKIFTIAGSDPSGGAGVQADIKTISALGGYAMAAITALTVQNTVRISAVHPVSAHIIEAQVRTVLKDISPDAIKVGMMGSAEIVEVLAKIFSIVSDIPLVLDPVILSTSGFALLEESGVEIMKTDIFPHVTVLTPNLAEAEKLSAVGNVSTLSDMKRAGEKLLTMGPKAVLIKGGHLSQEILTDLLVTDQGMTEFSSPRIETRHTHGTGCTLASAIATGIGQGLPIKDATQRAHDYVNKAILHAPGFGQGQGPLNHLVTLD